MVLKIGHRGARGYEPENTLISFKKAISMGVDFIELDVHLSKDNNVIIMHDRTLNRTTNGRGRISEKTLKEIKSYRTDKNQPIPTLQEVIDSLKGKTRFNIGIKNVAATKHVAEIIKKNRIEKKVLVASKHPESLIEMKKILPRVETALVYKIANNLIRKIFFVMMIPLAKLLILKKAKDTKVDYIQLNYLLATRNTIKRLQEQGYKVNVWTVNNQRTIKKMIERGVDGIISDYPDRI
jgi:glycerophosphoryl diester phosphodiesterase